MMQKSGIAFGRSKMFLYASSDVSAEEGLQASK